MAAQTDHQHLKDLDRIATPLGKALAKAITGQKAEALRAYVYTKKAAAEHLRTVLLPAVQDAVHTGAARVPNGVVAPDLAQRLADSSATSIATTTGDELDTLTTTTTETTETPVGAVFTKRASLMALVALGVISQALNAGAQTAAASQTPPGTTTWVVTQDNACATCSGMTGQSVPAGQEFPAGLAPIHPGCYCTVTYTPPSAGTERSDDVIQRFTSIAGWTAAPAAFREAILAEVRAITSRKGDQQ